MSDAAPEIWFLTTALMVGPNGAHTAISGLVPADSERTARFEFIEGLLAEQGPRGWAIKEVSVGPIPGLVISRATPPAEADETA